MKAWLYLRRLFQESDKRIHFWMGFYLGSLILVALEIFGMHGYIAFFTTFVLVTLIGFGFELFSYLTKFGYADFRDGIATSLGALPLILYYL